METNMKVCKICKTPVEESLAVEVTGGHVHPGPCLAMLRERESSLNESVDAENIQMIM